MALAYKAPGAGAPAGGVYMTDGPKAPTDLGIKAVVSISAGIVTAVRTFLMFFFTKLFMILPLVLVDERTGAGRGTFPKLV